MSKSIRIKGGTVLTMDDEYRVVQGDVLVRDGVIVSVGEPAAAAVDVEIDAGGRVVLPGFVQAHIHLCQTLFRNRADDLDLIDWLRRRIWPFEAAHAAESMRASVRLGLAELLKSGATCVCDMGSVRHTDVIFEEALASGIRGFFGKALMDMGEGVPRELLEGAGDGLAESLELIEAFDGAGGGRIQYTLCPRFILSCTDGLLSETARISKDRTIAIHTHAAESRREAEIVERQRGSSNIRHLHRLGVTGELSRFAHCVWADKDELEILVETGTRVLHCPGSNLKLGSGIAPVPEFLRRGLKVGLGSDGAPCNNSLDPFIEMRLAALVQSFHEPGSFKAREVVRMATRGGAEALGLDHSIGSIQAGRRADLAILDLEKLHAFGGDDLYSRLVYSARASDVTDVLVDGDIVVRDGRLLTMDEASVLAKAGEALTRLMARVQFP